MYRLLWVSRSLAILSWPLRWLATPNRHIESYLGLALNKIDRSAVMRACIRDGVRIGRYYHWYLEKKLVSRFLRSATRTSLIRLIKASDTSELEELDRLVRRKQSAVLALPHFGHYILAALSIVLRYAADREVGILYADPATHPGNALFDKLHSSHFSSPDDLRVRVLHANRSGIIDAFRLLRRGGLLIMMPDVHQSPDKTYLIPFIDHSLHVMLGTAAIARKTKSALIPILPEPSSPFRFRLRFACLDKNDALPNCGYASAYYSEWQDYSATTALFKQYEEWMCDHTFFWQYIREHFMQEFAFPYYSKDDLDVIWPTFLADPRTHLHAHSAPIDIYSLGSQA